MKCILKLLKSFTLPLSKISIKIFNKFEDGIELSSYFEALPLKILMHSSSLISTALSALISAKQINNSENKTKIFIIFLKLS